jgi:cytochrome c biogenesis protein CcmG/thiol:disulfide interchange protein DsbE
MKKIIFYMPVTLIIILSVFFYFSLKRDSTKTVSPLIGKDIPSFSLKGFEDANNFFTSEDLLGDQKIKFINIWASWCIPCKAEHDVLKIIAKIDNVEVYGINYKDNHNEALDFLEKLGNPYKKIGIDDTGRASIEWGVFGVPETYIVYGGKIIYKHVGPIHISELESKILPIIKELI